MNSIGLRLIRLRNKHDLKQSEVAKIAGIRQSSVSDWESDKTKPSSKSLIRLSEYYGVTPDYILNGAPPGGEKTEQKEERSPYKIYYKDIPVVSYVRAGDPDIALDVKEEIDAIKVRTYKKCSDRAYALEISGNSMTTDKGRYSFPEGDYIAVDPEQRGDNTNGIFVIAKEVGRDAVNFKQLKYEGSRPYLNPLNDKFDKYFGEFIILGKVFDHIPKDLP